MNINLQKPSTDKQGPPSTNWSIEYNKFIHMSPSGSPTHGGGGGGVSVRTLRNIEGIHRRHDRDFTVSWARKQDEKRKENFRLSPFDMQSPKTNDTQVTISPLTKKNRKFVVHLASEVDNELHKVPLYKNNVLELRQQNDRILQQILLSKQEYQKGYNKIAEEHRFGKYRSQSVHPRSEQLLPKQRLLNNTPSLNDQREESSLQLSIVRGGYSKSNDDNTNNMITPSLRNGNPDSSSCSTLPSRPQAEKSKLLKGLEKIYYEDLQKRVNMKEKTHSLSPERIEGNQEEIAKAKRQPRNFKDFLGDGVLLRKLKNPYAKKLPFEKPVTGNIKDEMIRDLEAIQTKAEILRNIKKIHRTMAREAKSIESLPRIKEISCEEEGKAKQKGTTSKRKLKKKMMKQMGRKDSANLKFWASQINSKEI